VKRNHHTINFDTWSELAKSDPDAFETLRNEIISKALDRIDTPKRHKFECLQWRIDQIRLTTKTPLSACIKISQLMWTSFEELHDQYYDVPNSPIMSITPRRSATILPFRPLT